MQRQFEGIGCCHSAALRSRSMVASRERQLSMSLTSLVASAKVKFQVDRSFAEKITSGSNGSRAPARSRRLQPFDQGPRLAGPLTRLNDRNGDFVAADGSRGMSAVLRDRSLAQRFL